MIVLLSMIWIVLVNPSPPPPPPRLLDPAFAVIKGIRTGQPTDAAVAVAAMLRVLTFVESQWVCPNAAVKPHATMLDWLQASDLDDDDGCDDNYASQQHFDTRDRRAEAAVATVATVATEAAEAAVAIARAIPVYGWRTCLDAVANSPHFSVSRIVYVVCGDMPTDVEPFNLFTSTSGAVLAITPDVYRTQTATTWNALQFMGRVHNHKVNVGYMVRKGQQYVELLDRMS
jgi:hypothetical protein